MEQADDRSTWVGAEGERDGKPFIVRARRFEPGAEPMAPLPVLLVIDVTYECFDETRLPFREQYEQADIFEHTIFDALEQRGQLKFVFAETGDGKIRYFTYVRDAEGVVAFLKQKVSQALPVEIFSGSDPQWDEYKRRMAALLPPES
ncbi:MAG: DUF695 domain-containing protein [Alphaproteobacteria bacterium]